MVTHAAANSRQMLLSSLLDARAATDQLFAMVRPQAMYVRPIAERHRIVFYVGHLEAFDWNLFANPCGLASFHPAFDRLFAFGIDPVGGGLPADQPHDWPRLQEVERYRDRVRLTLDAALQAMPDDGAAWLGQQLHIAREHRLMHAETLAYMFHQLPFECKIGVALARVLGRAPAMQEGVFVPAGSVTLGLSRDSQVFGWDNEFEAHGVDVSDFTIDKWKVTNGQFLQFLDAGGYNDRALWAAPDWEWKSSQGIRHPVFWARRGSGWAWRSMFDEIPLPLDWPVYASHAEARAYARWKGQRLPTEAQWQRAAQGTREVDGPAAGFDPLPVNARGLGVSAFGAVGLFANGWEWTSTRFAPFPGFRPFALYPGYSAPFFDGRHYVMKGGSVRTAACMLRGSFRNWFQPHYQYVYAGFRCVSE